MATGDLYQSFDRFVIRVAAQSYDILDQEFWEDPESWCAERLLDQDWIDSNHSRDRLMEAVAVASPSLIQAWQRTLNGRVTSQKKLARVTSSLVKYLVRMCTRPTPFGLFAGVALGSLSQSAVGVVHPLGARKYVRPGYSWIAQLSKLISDQSAEISLRANPDSILVEDRIYFSAPDEENKSVRIGSIRVSRLVELILEYTQQPQTLERIEELCTRHLPSAYHDRVPVFIRQMEAAGALIRCLMVGVTTDWGPSKPLSIDSDAMRGIHDEDLAQRIERANSRLIAINSQSPESSLQALLDLHDDLQQLDIGEPRLRADLATSLECGLPAIVFERVEQAGELLLRLSSLPTAYWHMVEFCREFTERYGASNRVPLLEVLSEFSGVGPLPTYRHPARSWPWDSRIPERSTERRDELLLRIATNAIRENTCSYELSEVDIEQLTIDPRWQSTAPKTMDIFCSIAAEDDARIDSGEFTLVVGPVGAKSPAGQSIGRFVGGLQEEGVSYLDDLNRFESDGDNVIHAEVVFSPPDLNAADTLHRRHPYDYEILVDGTRPSLDAEHCIFPAEIDVSVDMRGNIWLYSRTHGRPVVPKSTHRLSPMLAPNMARFLSEVGDHMQGKPRVFDWGAATSLDFTPRLQWQGVVLAPAMWRFRLDGELTYDAFEAKFLDWCQTWGVPSRVQHAVSDNRLMLDITSAWARHYLFRELKQAHGSLVLQEILPSGDHLWIRDHAGHRYASEMVFSLRLRTPTSEREALQVPPSQEVASVEPLPSSSTSNETDEVFVPGSAWSFFKIYLPEHAHDDWLVTSFRAILQEVEAGIGPCLWFFVRYRDPHPHLRLRFRVRDDERRGELFRILTGHFQGPTKGLPVVGRVMMDTYRRETARYGGPASIGNVEEIFAVQSRQALSFLHDHKGQSDDRVSDAMIQLLQFGQLFEQVGCDLQRLWSPALSQDGPAKLSTTERNMYRRAISAASSEGEQVDDERLRSVVSRLVELHQGDTDPNSVLPNIFSSMVHMQCNRLIGIDPASEMSIRNVVLRAVKAKHLMLGRPLAQ